MTLFFVRESDIRRERKEVIQEKIELKQKNERLEKKVSDLSEALMDCTTKNQIRSILDSLNKK
jgi:hypothetical protein